MGLVAGVTLSAYYPGLLWNSSDPGSDLLILTVCAAVLTTAALAACLAPVRRATRLDPMSVLRCE